MKYTLLAFTLLLAAPLFAEKVLIEASTNTALKEWVENQRKERHPENMMIIEFALLSLESFDDLAHNKGTNDDSDEFSATFLRILDGMEVKTMIQFSRMVRIYGIENEITDAYSDGGLLQLLENPLLSKREKEDYLSQFTKRKTLIEQYEKEKADLLRRIDELEGLIEEDNQAADTTATSRRVSP